MEGVARVRSPTPAVDAIGRSSMRAALFEFDASLGHTPRPDVAFTVWDPEWQASIRFNSLGLRGPEPTPVESPVRRVLMLGDSFTMGAQVDEAHTAAHRLAESLSSTEQTEVWNAGVEDYGTKQASRRATALLEAGHPFDAIVLNFYMGNDLIDNDRARLMKDAREAARAEGGERRPGPSTGAAPPGASPGQLQRRGPRPPPRSIALAWARLLYERAFIAQNEAHIGRLQREVGVWCDAPFLSEAIPQTRDALATLARLARQHEVPLVVSLIPPEWVVHPEKGVAAADSLGLADFDPAQVPRALREVMPRGVEVVDLTPAMQQASSDDPLFFRYDGHWTEQGHAVVAEALVEPVEAILSRPPSPSP